MSSSRNTVSVSLATSDMVITVDTRERSPWRFQNTNTPVIFSTLKTGDYSVRGLEDVVVIERKEHGDFLTSCGKNRRRFMAEMERMKSIPHRLLIVETDYTSDDGVIEDVRSWHDEACLFDENGYEVGWIDKRVAIDAGWHQGERVELVPVKG